MNKNICEVCGKEFLTIKKPTKTCSKKCCDKRYNLLHKSRLKDYRLKNKDKIKKRRATYYLNNIEKERASCREWYKKHRESEIEKNKEYRKQNRELFYWYHNKERFGGMKNVILKRDSYKCRVCSTAKKLAIHHKDGRGYYQKNRYGIELNNDISNLMTLCVFCHGKLHGYQRKNKIIILQDEDIVRTIRRLIEADSKSLR